MEIVNSSTISEGIQSAKQVLYSLVDAQTVLFLSGGKTPKELYHQLSVDGQLQAGAVAMVDERPDGSNVEMIEESKLLDYLKQKNIPFYSILSRHSELDSESSAGSGSQIKSGMTGESYEQTVEDLFAKFPKRIAILGIGADGHTAGLQAGNSKLETRNLNDLVIVHDEVIGGVKGRISLSIKALEQMNKLVLLVFGEDKKEALEQMLRPGSESEIPARFYTRPEIAKKTLLITDKKV